MRFEPLVVRARLHPFAEGFAVPGGRIDLDALLMFAAWARSGLPPALDAEMVRPIEIPVEREPGGRFHLASASSFEPSAYRSRFQNRRFPIAEATRMSSMKRVLISGGPCKSFHIPYEVVVPAGGLVTWWCKADATDVRSLLTVITHLGRKRSVGLGRVGSWEVEPCETWEGFPVLRDGQPLRNLPTDWPGLAPDSPRRFARLSPPYWMRRDEITVACPA